MRSGTHAMGRTEWILLFALAFLWSWVFFLTKIALGGMGPVVVVLAGLRMPASPRVWVSFFGMGALNDVVPFCLIAWGQIRIASGLAAMRAPAYSAGTTNLLLVTLLMPAGAMLLGAAILGEQIIQAREMAGMALIGLGLITIDGRVPEMLGLHPQSAE